MSDKSCLLVLPNQLFYSHPQLSVHTLVVIYEHPWYFNHFSYHKQKLIFHRASMKAYQDFVLSITQHVLYIAYDEDLEKFFKKKNIENIYTTKVVDAPVKNLLKAICKKLNIQLIELETPMFLTPHDFLKKHLTGKKQYLMARFYQAQRKRMNVLMENGKPAGGSWSYDDKNREPLPLTIKIPPVFKSASNGFIKEAIAYVQENFPNNPGYGKTGWYPVTRRAALGWLNKFLKERFAQFGNFQDAMKKGEPTLFHSILSPLLNSGILTPREVLDRVISYATEHQVPLNSLEGFIRQLIGWREFVWGIYLFHNTYQRKHNFFRNKRPLSTKFYEGITGLVPVDEAVKTVLRYGYSHHIERLMVLGNCMLLCRINPQNVYSWFMELYIDAYDWVMVPNIFGMSQFTDGGLMMTKPYISGSRYLIHMGNWKKGPWSLIWDSLYWVFLYESRAFSLKSPRWKMMLAALKKVPLTKILEHKKRVKYFFKSLT